MIEAPDFLPLGSIVTLRGNDEKRLMVVGRAMAVDNAEGVREYYDYGLVLYPEGLIGDAIVYSNHDCVTEVFFRGCDDDENAAIVDELKQILRDVDDIPHSHPEAKGVW